MVPDEVIISEAIRLVSEGVKVTFPVRGRSMRPFIKGGEDSLVLEKPTRVCKGDVVLAQIASNYYVVHRVIALDGENVTLMGDGNLSQTESCRLSDVKAVATYVVSVKGKKRSLENTQHKLASRIWYKFRFIRKWLLLVCKIFGW